MKANLANLPISTSTFEGHVSTEELSANNTDILIQLLCQEMQAQVKAASGCVEAVAQRIAKEVKRICDKSSRIQTSGEIQSWQLTLSRHRLQKCLHYYQLGSRTRTCRIT